MKSWVERLFFLFVFSLGFAQPAAEIGGLRTPASDFIFLLLASALAVALILRSIELRFDTSYVFLAAYALSLGLSAAFSLDRPSSSLKLLGELYLISLPVLIVHLIDSATMLRRTILVWIAASTIVSIIGVITVAVFYLGGSTSWNEFFLHHYGSLPTGNYPRIQSTFFHPAMLANYLNVSISLLIAALLTGWLRRSLAIMLLVLHLAAVIFTVTPGLGGTFLILGIWVAIVLKGSGHKMLSRLSLATGIFIATLFLAVSAVSVWPISTSPFWFEPFGVRLDPTQRMLTWIGAFETFLRNPLFGAGVGMPVADVRFAPPTGGIQVLTDAHNTILSVAAQAGLLGLSAMVSLMVYTIRRGRSIIMNDDGLGLIRVGLLVAFAVSFVYEGLFGSFENARHLWVLIGLILAVSRIKKPEAIESC